MSDITGLLDRLREQILAKNLSRRNDLINKSQNAAQLIRIIDEDPNFIFDNLVNKRRSLNLKHLMPRCQRKNFDKSAHRYMAYINLQ